MANLDIRRFREGDSQPAASELNTIGEGARRFLKPGMAGNVQGHRARSGLAMTSNPTLPILATITGASSPYSWSEVGGSRSGTSDAYEINGVAGLSGKKTALFPAPTGEMYFQDIRKGGGSPPCLGEIVVSVVDACSLASLSGSVGVTITVKDSLGVTVGTSTASPYTLIGLPMGVYTITAVGGTGYTASVSPSTVTLSTCDETGTATVTWTRADTFKIVLIMDGADNCYIPGASVTFTSTGGYSFTTGITSIDPSGMDGQYETPSLPFTALHMGLWTITASAANYTTTSWPDVTIGCATDAGSHIIFRNLPYPSGMWASSQCVTPMPASVTITIGNVGGGTNPVANPGTYTCAYVPGTDGTFLSTCTLIGGQKYRYAFIRGIVGSGNCIDGLGGTVSELRWNGLNPGYATCSSTPTAGVSVAMVQSSAADGCGATLNLAGADANVSGSVTL
ncbi:hypothetical protein EP7_005641 (plasmid) [Isosphaeraceae bacterium EP7]